MYDLYVDGLRDIQRSLLYRKVRVSRRGLVGVVDSLNKVFYTPHQPLLSAATTVIHTSGSVVDASTYDLDAESGCVEFDSAPSVQPEASYYQVDMTDSQVRDILWRGFVEMESRWTRGYRLSSGSASYVAATGDEAHAYVMGPVLATDPVIAGTVTFSTSLAQRALFLACAELMMLISQANYSAAYDYSWKEDRGMAIDKKSVAPNLEAAIARQEKKINSAVLAAEQETYGAGAMGIYIGNPKSEDYLENYEWQTEAKDSGDIG